MSTPRGARTTVNDAAKKVGSGRAKSRTWLELAESHQNVVIGLSIGVIVLTVLLTALTSSPDWLKSVYQIATAVFGAALGSFLQKDRTRITLSVQVGSATRHLLDHTIALRETLNYVDGERSRLAVSVEQGKKTTPTRDVETLLTVMNRDIRGHLRDTESAVKNWADINDVAVGVQLEMYEKRSGVKATADGNSS